LDISCATLQKSLNNLEYILYKEGYIAFSKHYIAWKGLYSLHTINLSLQLSSDLSPSPIYILIFQVLTSDWLNSNFECDCLNLKNSKF